jgi:uncharacterized membrane protein YqiK
MLDYVLLTVIGAIVFIFVGIFAMVLKCYKKVEQGTALIRNGLGGTKVSFSGMVVFPVIHRMEILDISVKRIEIDRMAKNGLICQDNMRADVKVAFFVRVNKTPQDCLSVAQSLGCVRASDTKTLMEFFDAKFSEALKTVGKQFDYVELYTNRMRFKEEILKVIGTDLNGYVLDDAAIDYLEQTNVSMLDPDNILDAEGIKKITDLTAKQAILSNDITRDKEKIIRKQDVEAREVILELDKQLAEAEQIQAREVAEITARQQAGAMEVQQQERLKAERARIATEEEVEVAEQNKQRQIIVALKSKQRTDAVETERVEKDRHLEATERERVVTLAQIDKDKAVEVEKRNIQEVIRERVTVERSVVEQEEKIKDTKAFATADRGKQVAITQAEQVGEEEKVKVVKVAEASKDSAQLQAQEVVITAEGQRAASEKEADARKIIADAKAEEEAVQGMGEARAMSARADATQKYGEAEATVIEAKAVANAKGEEAKAVAVEKTGLAEASVIQSKATAEAKGDEAKAQAVEKTGLAEALVMKEKYAAEANGIHEKAASMKEFDAVGKEHEEFKLQLKKDLDVQLASINIQREIARAQAEVVGEALKSATIDIVGGETTFFDKIVSAVTTGKVVDRTVDTSGVLTDIRHTFFDGDSQNFKKQLKEFVDQFGLGSEDVKNLSIAALLTKMTAMTDDDKTLSILEQMSGAAREIGLSGKKAGKMLERITS